MTPVLRVLERLWLPIVLIAVWWIGSANSTNPYVPSLEKISTTLWRDIVEGGILNGAMFSLTNLAVGLGAAIVVGVGVGLLLGESKWLFDTVSPLIHFIRSVPQAALVPLIIGAFGIGAGPKMWAIGFACVWPILLNTIDGVRGIEPTIRRFGKVYRITPWRYFRRVVLPGALPQIFAGIRVALPIGITVMVVSELYAANRGVGFYILNSSSTFQMAQTWAGAVLVGIVGYAIILIFSRIERIPLRWYFKSGAMAQ